MKKNKIIFALVAAMSVFGNVYSQSNDILTGPVGIGTSAPCSDLHIHNDEWHEIPEGPIGGPRDLTPPGQYYTTFRMTNTNSGPGPSDGFFIKLLDYELTMKLLESSNIKILAKNSQGIIIDSAGRIGMGMNPALNKRLVVNGDASFIGATYFTGNIPASQSISALNMNATGNLTVTGTASIGNGFFCTVNGQLKTKEIVVTLEGWSDYVFDSGYRLMPLGELERYVNANKHLPNIPSATEVEKNGVNVGEMNALLLEKIEELTLYIIDLQKQIDELKNN